jgi:hypothetical protein
MQRGVKCGKEQMNGIGKKKFEVTEKYMYWGEKKVQHCWKACSKLKYRTYQS